MARIAIQMWTVRHEAEKALQPTLVGLREAGFEAVESGGLYGLTPKEFRTQLSDAGLELCGAHTPLPEPKDADATFSELAELGAPAVFPSLGADWFIDEAAVGRAADRFNSVVPISANWGIELGYHNHWWEFITWPDGTTAYDRFIALLDPRVLLQVDTYWVQVGGRDASEMVQLLGERIYSLHIKDGPITKENSDQTAIGDGKMDISAVVNANPFVHWDIVELDDYAGNIWDAVKRSYSFLSSGVG